MDIKINGHVLKGDFFDADFIDRYESATKKMRDRADESRRKKYTSLSEGYRDRFRRRDG